jgi:4'-phosphopantetheinyl transferase
LSENKLFELWLGNSVDISKQLLQNKKNVQSTGDFFFESILKKYRYNFTQADIKKNEHGKPYLPDENISFNMSHCDDQIVMLVCDQEFCGIDIQASKSRKKFDDALKSVFTDKEQAILNKLNRDSDSFQLWSLKEAYIKAIGSSIWFGRDYDFSENLPHYSDLWFSSNDLFLYSMKIDSGLFLSIAVPQKPKSLVIKKI